MSYEYWGFKKEAIVHVELYMVPLWKDFTHMTYNMSIWAYTCNEWNFWVMIIYVSIMINVRCVDLHGLWSLNAIYVNYAWLWYYVHAYEHFEREVSMMIMLLLGHCKDNYIHTLHA